MGSYQEVGMVPQNVTVNCTGFCNSFCPRKLNCCGGVETSSDEDTSTEQKKVDKVAKIALDQIKEPVPGPKKIEATTKSSGCILF